MLRWAMRDALLGYEEQMRTKAREDYLHAVMVYVTLAPHAKKGKLKPPKVPKILRGS